MSIQEAKTMYSDMILGKFGIHGVGVNNKTQSIRIYSSREMSYDEISALDNIFKNSGYMYSVMFEDNPKV